MAVGSMGVKLYWSETTPSSTSTAIGEVVGFTGPGFSAPIIDVTHLQSTVKEKLLGVYDPGQISLDINFVATGDLGQKSMRASMGSRVKGGFVIQLSTVTTSQKIRGDGFITAFSVQGAVDNAVKGSVTIDISGPVTWAT